MKRILSIITILSVCVIALLPAAPAKTANAETTETYAVAATEGVWFYSEANESKGLFIIPYSYYVRVLSDSAPFCEVQYLDKTGYCLRGELLFVDFIPSRPFLRYNYTLSYSMDSGSAIGSGAFDSVERTVTYYGNFNFGTETYYYVYADGVYDYVPKTQDIIYDYNTDYLTPASADVTEEETSSSEGGLSGVQIAVICIVCALAVVVAFFVLRGKKPPLLHSDEQADL